MTNYDRFYNRRFYEGQMEGSHRSALRVLSIMFAHFKPRSVVDFGCGVGAWLRAAKELGVDRAVGIDGHHVKRSMLQIPECDFLEADLAQASPSLNQRYDLAMSLEVAEHLPLIRAKSFVDEICTAADTVIFSAAFPGQGGTHHVNEQYPSFWIPMFTARGFKTFDFVRLAIWDDSSIELWYRQNILVFSRGLSFPEYRENPRSCDIVHPEFWESRGWICKTMQVASQRIRMAVGRVIPATVRQSIGSSLVGKHK